MHPLCTLVHKNRGPTPRNHPATPSVLYIILSPVKMDDVSRLTDPGRGVYVEGDEVEIVRICWFTVETDPEDVCAEVDLPGTAGTGLTP
jgi:hypothetical protein